MRVLIFDFDGTLVDTRKDIATAVNHARKHFLLPQLTLPEITGMVGDGVSTLARRAFARTRVDPDEAASVILTYYSAYPDLHATLYPGVAEVLPRLPGRRVIVSNKPEPLIRALLKRHELASHFDFVAGGETFERRKPDPMAIDFLEKCYSVSRAEMMMIGDHSPDVEMAKRAGIASVYCNYGFFGRDVVGADYQIESFSELLEVLERIEQAGAADRG